MQYFCVKTRIKFIIGPTSMILPLRRKSYIHFKEPGVEFNSLMKKTNSAVMIWIHSRIAYFSKHLPKNNIIIIIIISLRNVLHEVRMKRRIKKHSGRAAILFCFSDFSHKEQVALASNYFESFEKKKIYAMCWSLVILWFSP